MTDNPMPVSVASLPAKWRVEAAAHAGKGPIYEVGQYQLNACADELEQSLRALPGNLEAAALETHSEVCVDIRGECKIKPPTQCITYRAILAALQSAAISGWQRCPVTGKAHEWPKHERQSNSENFVVELDNCAHCRVQRSAITPAEAGSQ